MPMFEVTADKFNIRVYMNNIETHKKDDNCFHDDDDDDDDNNTHKYEQPQI